MYDTDIVFPIMVDTFKDVGAAGADNANTEPEAKEVPITEFEFVEVADMVYVESFKSPERDTELAPIIDVA